MQLNEKIENWRKAWGVDKSWTLFLDRDGVINKKLPEAYVRNLSEFEFKEGALESLKRLAEIFDRIVIVTNQQGIGKGIMSEADLNLLHEEMELQILEAGGRLDAIYHCPNLAAENHPSRKPNTGMALSAQEEFPEIDFKKSIIVGDSESDMELGRRLGMKTVFVARTADRLNTIDHEVDMEVMDLKGFC